MPRRLTSWVHGIVDPDTGNARSFGPDDVLPGWAAEQITNPDAWTDGKAPRPSSTGPSDDQLVDAFERGRASGTEHLEDVREAAREAARDEARLELCELAGVATLEELEGVIRAGVAAIDGSNGEGGTTDKPPVEQPKRNGSQPEWATYAIEAHDADPAEAEQMTRDDLIERYGS